MMYLTAPTSTAITHGGFVSTRRKCRRKWIPSSAYTRHGTIPTSVRHWTWTAWGGLKVTYIDGRTMRSEWRTLRAFLKGVREGREVPVQEVPA